MLVARLAVDEDLVGASFDLSANDDAVNDCVQGIVKAYVRVVARGARVVQDYAVVWRAANRAGDLRRQVVLPLATRCVCDFQLSHKDFRNALRGSDSDDKGFYSQTRGKEKQNPESPRVRKRDQTSFRVRKCNSDYLLGFCPSF